MLHSQRWFQRAQRLAGILAVSLILAMSSTAFAVSIVEPKPLAVLSGVAKVWAVLSPDETCAYAVLCVDAQGRSITNMQPLRFEIDTRLIPNGQHSFRVDLGNTGGIIGKSPSITVYIANGKVGSHSPKVVYGPYHKGPAPAKPVPPATIVAKPKPMTAPGAPVKYGPNPPPALTKTSAPAPVHAKAASSVKYGPYPPALTKTPAPAPDHVKAGVPTKIKPNADVPVLPPVKLAPAPLPVKLAPPVAASEDTDYPLPARYARMLVVMDGQPIVCSAMPEMQDGHLLVRLRPLVAAVNGTIDWNSARKRVTAVVNNRKMTFTPGTNLVRIDEEQVAIARPVTIVDGWTIVPITIWRDLFGGNLDYNPEYGSVCLHMLSKTLQARVP